MQSSIQPGFIEQSLTILRTVVWLCKSNKHYIATVGSSCTLLGTRFADPAPLLFYLVHLGVNVTVNTKTVAPFVLGATPSTLVNLLATALQLTNMDVGVEQFISSDNSTVVLQVAVDATKAGNVTLTAVATAVPYVAPVLPPAPPDANATCVYSAPVWIPGPDSTVNQTVYVESFPPQPRYPNPPAAAAPAPAAVDLSTVTVEVTAVSVVVSATKPKWRLWGTDTYNDTVLEYNASIDDVTKALYAPWQIYDEKRTRCVPTAA